MTETIPAQGDDSPNWAALTDGTQWHVEDNKITSEIKPGEPGWRDIPRDPDWRD